MSTGRRILLTGGSGFIGRNLAEAFQGCAGSQLLVIDSAPPGGAVPGVAARRLDLLDRRSLRGLLAEYRPSIVIHAAARTDLRGKDAGDYAANTVGVENLVEAVMRQPEVQRCIFLSSKLVCRNGYRPMHDEDYCPDTFYGESKVRGEEIIRNSDLRCAWCIARPTSIWGPWFGAPYKGFFLTIARNRYFHPGTIDPPKSFGFVGNAVFQLQKLLDAAAGQIHRRTFYLSDYDQFTIRQWAEAIAQRLHGRKIRTIPNAMMRMLAKTGDALQVCGCREPPITSFRLRNMWQDTTGTPLDNIRVMTGPLPYTMQQGVDLTIEWLRRTGQIR